MSIMDFIMKCLKDNQGKLENEKDNIGLNNLIESLEKGNIKLALVTKEHPLFYKI